MLRSMIRNERGQAMVEMVLVLPLLLALVFGIIEFGNLYATKIEMNNLAREAVRMAVVKDPETGPTIAPPRNYPTLEINIETQAANLGMSGADVVIESDNPEVGTITATVSYSSPLITGYILGKDDFDLSSTASMRFEGD